MQKRVVESQADETRSETGEKVAAQTRLTAEQFWPEWAAEYKWEVSPAENWKAQDWMLEFAEAFREKIEAELRARLAEEVERSNKQADGLAKDYEREHELCAGLREEIERLKQLAGTPTVNLWKQLKDEQEYSLKVTREAAALRKQQESWRKGTESNMKSMAKLAENLKEELGVALREAAALRSQLDEIKWKAFSVLTDGGEEYKDNPLACIEFAKQHRDEVAMEAAALRERATGLIKRLDLIMTWADSHFSKDLPIELNPWLDDLRKALSAAPERP